MDGIYTTTPPLNLIYRIYSAIWLENEECGDVVMYPYFPFCCGFFFFKIYEFDDLIDDACNISILEGKSLAQSRDAKFIETSSGIQHNVDELLVGILKQV